METKKTPLLNARVGSALTFSWDILWDKFITLFLIGLIIFVIQMPMSIANFDDHHGFAQTAFGVFAFLFMIFIVSPIKISGKFLFLKAIRKEAFEVKEIFDVFKMYINVVLASLLSFAIVGIGFMFLIIPGIIFACRLAFVPYLVMDKKLDAVKAVEESWRITRGYGWRILWFYIAGFFIIVAGFIVLIFGVIVAAMWLDLAFAGLYQAILEERGEYEPEAINSEPTPASEVSKPTTPSSEPSTENNILEEGKTTEENSEDNKPENESPDEEKTNE